MKISSPKTLLILMSIIILNTSCFRNFYLTNSHQNLSPDLAEKIQADSDKFIIVHFGDKTFELTKFKIANQTIEGDINKIQNPELLMYLNPEINSSNRYKKRYEPFVLNEIHIYTQLKSNIENSSHIQLSAKDISRIDIYKKDKIRNTTNLVLSILGVYAGVSMIAATIVLLSGPWFSFTIPLSM